MSADVYLIIGENDWPKHEGVLAVDFPSLDSIGLRLKHDRTLEVHKSSGAWQRVKGVLWRGQYDLEFAKEHALLCMIRASTSPCINNAECAFRYSDRISMFGAMQSIGLPTLPVTFFCRSAGLDTLSDSELPCVIKVGNWHMGYGKMKCDTHSSRLDAVDMAHIAKDYVAIEPFIVYRRDIRILIVGDKHVAIEREPSQWKANIHPKSMKVVDIPICIVEMSRALACKVGAAIIGVDWIQDSRDRWFVLEANLSPGLNGSGVDLRPEAMALLSS